jgi:hypothetical protein
MDATIRDQLSDYDWDAVFAATGAKDSNGCGNISCDIRPVPPTEKVSTAPFDREDIAELIGTSEGENEGPDWLCAGRLTDGRWFLVSAGCDYTGWDCQASGVCHVAKSREDLLQFGMDANERSRLGCSDHAPR